MRTVAAPSESCITDAETVIEEEEQKEIHYVPDVVQPAKAYEDESVPSWSCGASNKVCSSGFAPWSLDPRISHERGRILE